ncbi:RHS repeat domain-containing protein, partial [Pseudomonas putida]
MRRRSQTTKPCCHGTARQRYHGKLRPYLLEGGVHGSHSYHYDAHGRLRESINARGEHTHFRYDARGYLVESERPDGRIDRYEIDVAGQLTRYVDHAQKTLQFR